MFSVRWEAGDWKFQYPSPKNAVFLRYRSHLADAVFRVHMFKI
jgi:hypothetical protein